MTCVGEPVLRPRDRGPVRSVRAGRPGRPTVVVVGGGPAGLECARVAAGRGHRVAHGRAVRPAGWRGPGRRPRPRPGPAGRARRLARGRVPPARASRIECGADGTGTPTPASEPSSSCTGGRARPPYLRRRRRRRGHRRRRAALVAGDAAGPLGPRRRLGPDRRADRRCRSPSGSADRGVLVTPDHIVGHAAGPHRRSGGGQRPPAAAGVTIERRSVLRARRGRARSTRGPLHRRGAARSRPPPWSTPATGSPTRRRRARVGRPVRAGDAWHPAPSTRPCSRAAGLALAIERTAPSVRLPGRRCTYRYLWSPLPIGPVTVRNRIVFSRAPHQLRRATACPTRAARRLLRGPGRRRRRADHHRGALDPPDRLALREADPRLPPRRHPRLPAHHRGRAPPPARRSSPRSTTTAARPRRCTPACRCGRRPRCADPLFREVPKAVDEAEIAEIVAGYATVAEHCAEGGFDGIELQCSHSSIVRGFLSPATNLRTDGYGGPLEQPGPAAARDRRPPCGEVIGPGLALGVRICGDELIEGGTTHRRGRARSPSWSRPPGTVDYINTSIGVATATPVHDRGVDAHPARATRCSSRRAIRKAVDLPVIGVGRFKDPLQAERALAEGHCDLVGVVRGQIADADFAAKARAGADRRHPAVPVLQPGVRRAAWASTAGWAASRTRAPAGRPSGAGGAPTGGAGRDGERAGRRRRAGRAAGRHRRRPQRPPGHGATRRRTSAGGQVRLAASVPNRAELGDLVRNQLAECRRLGRRDRATASRRTAGARRGARRPTR